MLTPGRSRRAHLDLLVWSSTAVLATVAARRVFHQSRELVVGTSYAAAFDLHLRYRETLGWFSGSAVYELASADYPPASYALLGPLIGHLDWPSVRLLWLACSLAALVALSAMAAAAVGPRTSRRALAAVVPWAAYASALTLGVGQLGLLVLATGLAGVLGAHRARNRPLGAALAGIAFAVSLVKPNLTAPWFWLLCLAGWPPRAPGVSVALYLGATLAACAIRPEPLAFLLTAWIDNGRLHVARGYGSIAGAASALGHDTWVAPLGLAMLAVLGLWVRRHRHADLWLLLGVSAVVSRVFTYHYYVDDLLLIVPMVALLRLSEVDSAAAPRLRAAAGGVFALTALAQLTPTRLFTELGPAVARVTETSQVAVWLTAGALLVWAAGAAPVQPSTRQATEAGLDG